jgi:hypothetical protein
MPYATKQEGNGYVVYETELDEVKFGPATKEECEQKAALLNSVESNEGWDKEDA